MANSATLVIRYVTDASKAAKGVDSVSGKVGKFAKGAVKAGAAVAAALAGAALWKGFQRLNAIDQAQAKLKGLGYSSKQVEGIMSDVNAAVKGTSFGLDEAATAAAGALASGIKPGKDLTRYLALTGDAATQAGVDFNSMAQMMNKVQGQGKLTGDVVNQMAENGLYVIPMLAKEFKKPQDAIRKMVSNGEISAKEFQRVLQKNVGGSAQQAGKTVEGATKNVMAAMGRLGASVLSGAFSQLPKVLGGVTTAIDKLGPVAEQAGKLVGKAFGALIAKTAQVASKIGPALAKFSKTGIFKSLVASMKSFGSAIGGAFKDAGPAISKIINALKPLIAGAAAGAIVALTLAFHGLAAVIRVVSAVVSGLGAWAKASPGSFRAVASAVTAVAVAFGAWKAIKSTIAAVKGAQAAYIAGTYGMESANKTLGSSLAYNIGKLKAQSIALWGNIKAITANTAAWIRNAAQGLAVNLKWQLLLLRQWIAQKAAIVANTAATIASTVAEKAAAVASKAWSAAQWLLNAALSANPIGLVIAAIVAAIAIIVVLWKKNEGFRNFVIGAWKAISNAAVAAWNWIKQAVAAVINWAKPFLKGFAAVAKAVWKGISAAAKVVWKAIKAVIKTVVSWAKAYIRAYAAVVKAVWKGISAAGKIAWKAIKAVVKTVISWAKAYIRAYAAIVKAIWRAIATVARTTWNGIKTAVRAVVDWIKGAVRGMKTVVNAVWRAIKTTAGTVWRGIKTVVKTVIDGIKNILNGLKNTAKRVWDAIKNAAKTAFDAIKTPIDKVKTAIDNVIDAAKSLIDWLGKIKVPKIKLPNPLKSVNPFSAPAPAMSPAGAPMATRAAYSSPTLGAGVGARRTGATSSGSGNIIINVSGTLNDADSAAAVRRVLRNDQRRRNGVVIDRRRQTVVN